MSTAKPQPSTTEKNDLSSKCIPRPRQEVAKITGAIIHYFNSITGFKRKAIDYN